MHIKKFWSRVKTLIRRKGLTQETIAKYCGLSYDTLRGWMAKDIYPPLNHTMALARCLGVGMEFLVYDKKMDTAVQLEEIKIQLKAIEKRIIEIERNNRVPKR